MIGGRISKLKLLTIWNREKTVIYFKFVVWVWIRPEIFI